MNSKTIIRKTVALLLAAIVSTGAIIAQTVTPKQDGKGKWGMVDNAGKWVAKAEYAAIEPYEDGYYRMQKDGKWGLLRPDGKKALDCKYEHDMITAAEYIFAREYEHPTKWQAWDKICESKASFKNASIRQISDSISIISGEIGRASMVEYEDHTFNKFIDAAAPNTNSYRHQQLRKEAQDIVKLRYGGYINFLLNKNGTCINGISNVVAHLAGDIYVCTRQNESNVYNFIYNLSTGEQIAPVYSTVLSQPLPTDSTLFLLPMGGSDKRMYISNKGETYIDVTSKGLYDDARIIAGSDDKCGMVNEAGKIILPVEYDEIICDQDSRVSDGTLGGGSNYYLRKDNLWGILASSNSGDYNYKLLAECIYPYSEEDGEKYMPFMYLTYMSGNERDACFVVMSKGKAGVLDNFGKELVPCQYDNGSYSTNPRMAYLYDNGKEIMYAPADKSLTARKYSGYKRFIGAKSYYRVEQNGKFGVVDDKDNLILPFKYSNITEAITSDNGHLDDAFHVWDADGRIGVAKVINGKGKEIVPCAGNYDRIWGYESYGVIVVKNGKEGCIKENGATFCRTVYDGHINGMKRVGFIKNSGTSNNVSVDIYDYNGKYLTTVKVGNSYLDLRWFVQKYLM